jgi:hypothetical protein
MLITQVLAKFRVEFQNTLAQPLSSDLSHRSIFMKELHPFEAAVFSSVTVPGLEKLSLDSFLKTLLNPMDSLKEN